MKILGSQLPAALLLSAWSLLAQQAPQPSVIVEHNVPATMRDGTVLHADIYRPSSPGRYPVLLERTPYNKSGGTEFGHQGAAHGFVVVIQDVRGRYTSQGDWYPFRYESTDGYDTVEWAAALPNSNGKVGMFGGSYVGATQMLTAIAHPPHLAGICPVVTASNYHENWTYQGGAFEQWFNQSWTSGLAQDTLNRFIQSHTNATKGDRAQPLNEYPLFNIPGEVHFASPAFLAPYYVDWLSHPEYDDYWKKISIEEHYSDIRVPVFTVAAWYDIFLGGSLRNYQSLKIKGATEESRSNQYLLVTIGGHSGSGRKIGAIDFGPAAAEFNEDQLTLAWYEHLFQGKPALFGPKHVRLFVMGRNQWRDEDDWPLARARTETYFLHSDGHANTASGTGTLSTAAPQSETADRIAYDPNNPVPTIGGPLCCDARDLAPGPQDQRPNESRSDVLVYSTPPLASDVEITGPITLKLYASSNAVDTDFTGKLIDVSPDGFARNVTEGIVRAKYRTSTASPTPLAPSKTYEFTVDLWATSNVFLKDHRIRLEVSSSNFPRFDRNMNTGEGPLTAAHGITAENTVYHDSGHSSTLLLPVAPAHRD